MWHIFGFHVCNWFLLSSMVKCNISMCDEINTCLQLFNDNLQKRPSVLQSSDPSLSTDESIPNPPCLSSASILRPFPTSWSSYSSPFPPLPPGAPPELSSRDPPSSNLPHMPPAAWIRPSSGIASATDSLLLRCSFSHSLKRAHSLIRSHSSRSLRDSSCCNVNA